MFRSNSSNSRARAAINASVYSDSMVQKYIDDIATFPDIQAQIDILNSQVGNIYISADISNAIIDLSQQIIDLKIHDVSNSTAVQTMLTTTNIIESSLNILLANATSPINFSKTISQTITGNIVFSGNVILTKLNTLGLLCNDACGNLLTRPFLVDSDIAANAGITDNKLAIIQTTGKILPSATNASVIPLPGTIVLRDSSGDILGLTLPNDVSDNRVATTQFVQNIVAQVVDSSPETLNTLNELANAIGGDASFSQTIYSELDKKAPIVNPTFTANVFASRLSVMNYTSEGIVKVDASGQWSSGTIIQSDLSGVILTNAQLATITSPGKVANSATSATTDACANTIMMRGASGEWVNPRLNGLFYDPLPQKAYIINTTNGTYSTNSTATTNRPYSIGGAPSITRSQSEKALSEWIFSITSVKNVAYRNLIEYYGKFYAVHNTGIVNSTDVRNWSSNTWSGASPYGIAAAGYLSGNPIYIIVGANLIRTTTNFSSYTDRVSPTSTTWRNVVYSNELTTAVTVGLDNAAYSTDSASGTWISCSSVPSGDWITLCWSPNLGQFVAVGTNVAMYSFNGISWTAASGIVPNGSWNSVCWSPELNLYCAVAPTGTYRVMVSTDGIEWYGQSVPEMNAWQSVCWSPEMGMFCAVSSDGTNRLLRSFDGVNWKTYSIPTNTWRCIVWSTYHSVFCALHTSSTGEMIMSALNARIPTAYTMYNSFSQMGSTGKEWSFTSSSITPSSILNSPSFSGNLIGGTITNTVNPIYTTTNYTVANDLAYYGLASNLAQYRALNCVDASGIADYVDISQSLVTGTMTTGTVWNATRTYRRLGTITLPTGKWNLTYGMALIPSGTTGDVVGVETYLCTVDASNTGLVSTTESYDYSSYTLSAGNTYPFFPQRATIDVSGTTTYYLNGYVDYSTGIDTLATFGTGGEDTYMYAHRISTYYLDVAEMAKYFLQYPYAQGDETLLDASINGVATIMQRMSSTYTTTATSTSSAPVVVSGGVATGNSVVIGGNVYNHLTQSSKTVSRDVRIRDFSGTAVPYSGVAEGQSTYVLGGQWLHTNMSGSGNTVFTVKNSALTNANVVVNYARVAIPHNLPANSATTGALTSKGGISTQENLYASNLFATNVSMNVNVSVYSSTLPNTTGAATNGIVLADGSYNSVFTNATPITGMNANTFTNVNGTFISSASSIASADNGYSYNAFDGSNSTFWHCDYTIFPYDSAGNYTRNQYSTTIFGVGTISGEWLQIQFPYQVVMSYYLLRGRSTSLSLANSMPKLYYIVGSNNGTTWVQVDYRSDTNLDGPSNFEISYNIVSTTAYSYYRLVINKVYRSRQVADLAEWRISGYTAGITNPLNIKLPIGMINQSNETVGFGVNDNLYGNDYYAYQGSSLQMNARTDTTQLLSLSKRSNTVFFIDKSGNTVLPMTTQTTGISNGALVIQGGAGIRGNLSVGGNIGIYDGVNSSTIDQSGSTLFITNPAVTETRILFDVSALIIGGTISNVSQNAVLKTVPLYTPKDVYGLQLWFDANDYSTLVLGGTGGNELSQWNDKSGYGRNASLYDTGTTKNTYGATLYNGLPGIQFVYNQGFSAPLPAGTFSMGATMFVVFQKNGGSTPYETIISRTLTNSYPAPFDIYNASRLLGNGSSISVNQNSSFNIAYATNLNILSSAITFVNTNSEEALYAEWVNGTSTFTSSAGIISDVANAFYIGTRGNKDNTKFNGIIAEIIVYNRTISPSEREIIEWYLATKWNMRANLDVSHPYKSATPTYSLFSVSNAAINPVLNNAKLHNYIYNIGNLTTQKTVVAQSYSISRPNLQYVQVSSSYVLFNCVGKIRKDTVVTGIFFMSDNTQTSCQFGVYKGGLNPTLLASTTNTTNIQIGLNYIPFSSSWIVPSTGIYYVALTIPPKSPQVQFLSLPSSSYYYRYTTLTTGVLNRVCQFTTTTYATLPANISGIAFNESTTNIWIGLYR